MSKKSILIVVFVVVLLILIAVPIIYENRGNPAPLSSITINSIVVENDEVTILGVHHNSVNVFKGHRVRVSDDSMYITVKTGAVGKNDSNLPSDEIYISEPLPENVKRIYLDDGKKTQLLWERGKSTEEQKPDTNWRYAQSRPIQETDTHFYYIQGSGIIEFDKTTEKTRQIAENKSVISGLYLYENQIFYSTDQGEIYRTDLNGANNTLVWEQSQLDNPNIEFLGINDFAVHKNTLYIWNTGISVLAYDMDTNKTEVFLEDVSSIAFMQDGIYYTEHAEKTFSIYKMNLETGERVLVRGDGVTYSEAKRDLYDQLLVVSGTLYYTKRDPAQLYQYDENGADRLIADLSEQGDLVYLSTNGTDLYFAVQKDAAGTLFKYTAETDTYQEVLTVPEFYPNLTFGVVENRLIYFNQDHALQVKELN